MTLRILLVDDHDLLREAIRLTLESDPEFVVVADTGSSSALTNLVEQLKPDVVCMDVSMPSTDGICATQRIHSTHPGVKIIGLSAHQDPHKVQAMLEAGASGYVLKMHAGRDLVPAIHAVTTGLRYTSSELGI